MNTRKPRLCCDFCSKRCPTETGLRVHKRAVHLTEGVLCPYCSVILPSNLLTQHVTSCSAVGVNTSDALLHSGHNGMEENYLDDLPSRLTSLRYISVDWDSLLAHSLSEPPEREPSPVANYAPYTGASDDDYAEPLDMGDDDPSEKAHAVEASETSPVSEVENLRVDLTKSPRRTRSFNRSSLSALQRMLGVKRASRSLRPSKVKDAAPAVAPKQTRGKRGPDKRMTGKPRKKAKLLVSSSADNDELSEAREEVSKEKGKEKATEESSKGLSDDDGDLGNLVIDMNPQTDSSTVKETGPEETKVAKRKSQRQISLRMKKQMKDLVDKSRIIFDREKLKASKDAKHSKEASAASKGKSIDLDSSDETEEIVNTTGGRESKLVAKKKIKKIKVLDTHSVSSDDYLPSDAKERDDTPTSRKKKTLKRNVKTQESRSKYFEPNSVLSSDSNTNTDSDLSTDVDDMNNGKINDDDYDSDFDFGTWSYDRSLVQTTIPCPLGYAADAGARSAEMIGAPFASLFLCFIVDPKGGDVAPPLPGASSLPIVQYENEEDDMRSFMWICECCGLVKNSREKKESHVASVHISCTIKCPFCRGRVPLSLYAVHTWLLCRKIQRLYPPSLFSSQDLSGPRSFPCELCNGVFVTTCPVYYLRHVITFHSKIVNALAMERVECSRCHGFFHKAFISLHDYICRIASEMSISLHNLVSYHVDDSTASKLGRPLPPSPPTQKTLLMLHSPPKSAQKKRKTNVHLPQKSSSFRKQSLIVDSEALRPSPSMKQSVIVVSEAHKPNPLRNQPPILVDANGTFFVPVEFKNSTDQASAPNPPLDTDVMEIVDIPSSPETKRPSKEPKEPPQRNTRSRKKIVEKKNRRKQIDFSAIFMDNIFEPSSPPSSPRPEDTLEADDVDGLSKDTTLEGSVDPDGPSDGKLNFGLNTNEAANEELEESLNDHEDVENSKQNGTVNEEVSLKITDESTEACSNTDHATVVINQEHSVNGVSNEDQQPNGEVNEKQNEKGEPVQDVCVKEGSKKEDSGNEVMIVDVEVCYKKNICEFCGKGANLFPEFQAHKQKHKGGVRCPLCLTLLPRNLLFCHRRLFCPTLHKNVTWSLQCDLCQKAVPSPFHLLRHALDWHPKHVSKTPGQKAAADEQMRQRCEHCAAPVRSIFFDCHQEMCFRKLQFEMKARPLVKKVPPASKDAEAPDGSAASDAAEVPGGTEASDSIKVVDTADIDNSANDPAEAKDSTASVPASSDTVAAVDVPEAAESACVDDDTDIAGPDDASSNAITNEIVDDFEGNELVGVSDPGRRSESDDAAPIAMNNGFEAGLATPPHVSEDTAANNLDQGAMDCDFNLLMDDAIESAADLSSNSLRMSSTPPEQREADRIASFEREVSGNASVPLDVTASDAALFEDISEVLEAVMHENGQQSLL